MSHELARALTAPCAPISRFADDGPLALARISSQSPSGITIQVNVSGIESSSRFRRGPHPQLGFIVSSGVEMDLATYPTGTWASIAFREPDARVTRIIYLLRQGDRVVGFGQVCPH